jgi:hypothetical protein
LRRKRPKILKSVGLAREKNPGQTLNNARTDLIALKVVTRAIMEHIHLKKGKNYC